ncbi:protein GrpE-like isoform X1 [Zingiber officinale]|uniref:GrpE protein homolog n=1 Tax=Zingiber officinale TaxID=94328 RepID=A0A8J5EWX4_ZINOF|nr:protein GrpE-like isoform X1 [Zingiber officinale]KAG6475840.1 hypothetical protein ZIOFF_065069 [Zingiber officinale]
MAAIASHSLFPSLRPLTSSKSLKTSRSTSVSARRNPSAKFSAISTSLISSCPPRRSFKGHVNVADSTSKTISGEEENQISESINQKDLPSMGSLIQAYKEAIIAGDETTAQEIETLICTVENQKTVLSAKFAEITTLLATDKDQYLRMKADFENFRKKTEKHRLNFTSDIRGDVIESLLPMVDSFEKTIKEIKPETEKEKKIEFSYQGIYKQFVEVMRSFGVSVVETVGKPFDPSIHEAIAREESQEFQAGIITQELRRGFLLSGQLLRTATVKVSAGPVQVKANSVQEVEVKSPEDLTSTASNSD